LFINKEERVFFKAVDCWRLCMNRLLLPFWNKGLKRVFTVDFGAYLKRGVESSELLLPFLVYSCVDEL
jgi:hypothetical protein